MSRDYDLMLRCRDGHFIADVRKAPYMFADAYCKGCDDIVMVDWPEQLKRVGLAIDRLAETDDNE